MVVYELRAPTCKQFMDDDPRQTLFNQEKQDSPVVLLESDRPTTESLTTDTFSIRHPDIANEVEQLHKTLQKGNQRAQHKIDSYLLMYACSDTSETPIRFFQLLPADVLQYDSLPDITRFICMSFATEKLDGIIAYYMQYLSPLRTKNRMRRTKQVAAKCHVESSICLNLIQATVLGLYPRCCKRPLFETRVSLVACLYDLKTSTLARQNAFFLKAGNLLRMAFTEYLLNVRQDYCPVEHEYLCQQAKYLENYDVACVNATDSMRQSCLQKNNWSWQALNDNTGNSLDRIARMCRMSSCFVKSEHMFNVPKVNLHQIHEAFTSHVIYEQFQCRTATTPQQQIHDTLKLFALPWNFLVAQAKFVCMQYQEQTMPLRNYCSKYFCMLCACNNTTNILQKCTKLRIDVHNSRIVCAACNSTNGIIAINMFGKLLQIQDRFMFACHMCTALHEYDATAPLMCTNSTIVNSPVQLLYSKQDTPTNAPSTESGTKQIQRGRKVRCKWCCKVCAPRVVNILHIPTARILSITLCFKHTPPPHMWKFVHDVDALVKYLQSLQKRPVRQARKQIR
jgi:hypothetical protein